MAVEVLLARDIEKENLEAHVELCAERYRRLEEKLENVETKMSTVSSDLSGLHTTMSQDNKIIIKTLIATAGTIIVALVSAVAAVLTKMAWSIMTLRELTNQIRIPVYLSNEERRLYIKLKEGRRMSELDERERDVILYSLRIKGLVDDHAN